MFLSVHGNSLILVSEILCRCLLTMCNKDLSVLYNISPLPLMVTHLSAIAQLAIVQRCVCFLQRVSEVPSLQIFGT